MHPAAPTRIPLPDLAVLQVQGADALTFLQGQLSNDVLHLPYTEARLAAWCSAKGRVLATLVVWREPAGDGVYALVKADLAQALVKRLSMFVLRAKVTLRVTARPVAGEILAIAPHDAAPWRVWHRDGQTRIQAPDANPTRQRVWCIGSATAASTDAAAMVAAPDLAPSPAPPSTWHAADVAAGLPWIGADNQDVYIPQTLNLDLLGAISFTKGCYPGQEVVARSHYRGTVKRRMVGGVVGSSSSAIAPAADIYRHDQPGEPCGRIINAARANGVTQVLFEAPLDAVAAGGLHVGGVDGPEITQLSTQLTTPGVG